jgi:hypothetical protein
MIDYWGPRLWNILHYATYRYPNDPNKNLQDLYYQFFKNIIPFVIPCQKCRRHYFAYIMQLTQNDFRSRKSLVKWLFKVHNSVNKRKRKKQFTIENANKRYSTLESFKLFHEFLTYIKKRSQIISIIYVMKFASFLNLIFPQLANPNLLKGKLILVSPNRPISFKESIKIKTNAGKLAGEHKLLQKKQKEDFKQLKTDIKQQMAKEKKNKQNKPKSDQKRKDKLRKMKLKQKQKEQQVDQIK